MQNVKFYKNVKNCKILSICITPIQVCLIKYFSFTFYFTRKSFTLKVSDPSVLWILTMMLLKRHKFIQNYVNIGIVSDVQDTKHLWLENIDKHWKQIKWINEISIIQIRSFYILIGFKWRCFIYIYFYLCFVALYSSHFNLYKKRFLANMGSYFKNDADIDSHKRLKCRTNIVL